MLTSKSTVWFKNKSIFYNNVFFLGMVINDTDFAQSIKARQETQARLFGIPELAAGGSKNK